MKLGIIGDIHFGVNQDSIHFLENQKRFLMEVFWPKMDEENISVIICLGDVVHRRKYINYLTATYLHDYFFNEISKRKVPGRNLRCDWILGNHDLYYREMTNVSPAYVLKNPCNVWSEATTFQYAENMSENQCGPVWVPTPKYCFIPWICKENREQIFKHIEETDAEIAFGHLELIGYEMNKGQVNHEHGFQPDIVSKFKQVYTGHFHHPNKKGNVQYLAAATPQTWHDWADDRGFHILDSDTNKLTFYENPFEMFEKLWYDDSKDGEMGGYAIDISSLDLNHITGKIVKVIVSAKNDPMKFDLFMSKVEEAEPVEIQVVDDHLNFQLNDDEHIITEGKDTLEIIREFVQQANDTVNVEKLDKLVVDLYQKAQEGKITADE